MGGCQGEAAVDGATKATTNATRGLGPHLAWRSVDAMATVQGGNAGEALLLLGSWRMSAVCVLAPGAQRGARTTHPN